MGRTIAIVFLAVWITPVYGQSDLRELTEGHTRVVWVQDQTDKAGDVFAKGDALKLMGFDSDDGRGERVILDKPANYLKPLLTSDGKRVVFSTRRGKRVAIVDFDGRNFKPVTEGIALDIWPEPETGRDWLIVARRPKGNNYQGNDFQQVWRMPLDNPDSDQAQLLWNRTLISIDNFMLSRDGERAGGLFPWSDAGIAELPNGWWSKRGKGCWTSLAPDNSYLFWVFDGPHRNVHMHHGDRKWKVDIHQAPGIDGFEVYHPRWTNDPRFMVMTGPYKVGGGGNKIRGGGRAVEIYLGRFSTDMKRIERWVRISDNDRGDFYPDAWIEGGENVSIAEQVAPPKPEFVKVDLDDLWPGNHDGLQFVWHHAAATNQIIAPEGKPTRICRVDLAGKARYGRFHELLLGNGAATTQDAGPQITQACKASNELTVEATFTPANDTQHGPARIVSLSTDSTHRNFTLGQERDRLVMRLRTPSTGDNGTDPSVTFGHVEPGKTYHVIVTYQRGHTWCYVDGEQVVHTEAVQGDFSNWTEQALILGDEVTGDRDWNGRLEGVAIYNRAVSPTEAADRYKLYARRLATREPIDTLQAKARRIASSVTPDPKDIAPYRRALVVHTYEVVEGDLPKRINVAHWAILDGRRLAERDAEVDQVVDLTLEPFDEHPELEGERLMLDVEAFDLPMYFDVTEP